MRDRSRAHIEPEILDAIIVAEAASLPAVCRSSLYNEKCETRGIGTAGVKQRSENFLLRRARVNAGNSLNQRTR